MTTEKQIAANRRNAARSTGPKIEAGKAIVARNAVTHGLLSRHTLLVGESKAELTNLGKALRARLAPVGEVEALLADQIIASAWRLKHALEGVTDGAKRGRARIKGKIGDVFIPEVDVDLAGIRAVERIVTADVVGIL